MPAQREGQTRGTFGRNAQASGQAGMGSSLAGQGQGWGQQRVVPSQPQVPSLLGSCASEGLHSRMSTHCLAARISRAPGGASVLRKLDPGVLSLPHAQTGQGTNHHLRWHSPHLPASPHQTLLVTCLRGSHSPSFLFNQYTFSFFCLFVLFFVFLDTPMADGSSQARDRIQATAATYATAAATLDP